MIASFNTDAGTASVPRLRNLAMIESIRRAEDPAWRNRLERQQVVARLGRRFGHEASPLEAMQDHARSLQDEFRATLPPRRLGPR